MIEMRATSVILVMALLCVAVSSSPTSADPTPAPALPAELQQVEAQGQTSFDNHDFHAALASWQSGLQAAQQRNLAPAIARFTFDVGKAQEKLRQYADALTSFNAALSAHQALNDRSGQAADIHWIGITQAGQSHNDAAAASYQKALTIYKQLNDGDGQASVLNDVGDLNDLLGKPDDAMSAYKQGLDLYRASNNQRGMADILRGMGIIVANSGDYPGSLVYFQQALDIAKALDDKFEMASGLEFMGTVNQTIGHDDIALKDYAQALPIFVALNAVSQQAHVLNDMAFSYRNLGRTADEVRVSQQAVALAKSVGDKRNQATALGNLGYVEENNGRYTVALDDFRQQAALYHAIGWTTGEGESELALGSVERELRQYDSATVDLEQAIALDRASHYRNGEAGALVEFSALLGSLNRDDEAIQNISQAIDIDRATGNQRGQAEALIDKAVSEEHLKRYDDAIKDLTAARALAKAVGNPMMEGDALYALGVSNGNRGNLKLEYQYDEAALTLYKSIPNPVGEDMVLMDLAMADLALGHKQPALQVAQQAVAMSRQQGQPEWLTGSYRARAKAEAALDMRAAAIADFNAAIDQIESTRAGLSNSQARITFFAGNLGYYDEFIQYLWQLNQRYPGHGYDRKALEVFERKQARAALEQIGRTAARQFSGVPEAVIAQDMSADVAVEDAHTVLAYTVAARHPDASDIAAATTHVHDAIAKRNALQAQIKSKYPAYYALQHPSPIDATTLQQKVVKPGEVLLVYDAGDVFSLLWVVGRDRFQLLELPQAGHMQQGVAAVRAHIARIQADVDKRMLPSQISDDAAQDLPGFAKDSYALYQMLVPSGARSVVGSARSLVVIPSGTLYDLPWEVLVTQALTGPNARPHYLVQDHAISYIPSASLLGVVRTSAAQRRRAASPLLAVARPAIGGATVAVVTGPDTYTTQQTRAMRAVVGSSNQDLAAAFPDLPGAQVEADDVRAVLGAPPDSILSGDDASRAKLLALNSAGQLKDYRYFLFATHAVLPDQIQGLTQPALVLAHPENGDGFLTMADIFGLTLNADFVTLSACNTGSGPHEAGEGISGLTRAFLYAGTPAMSVTLWEVDDQVAPKLTPAFFSNLRAGDTPAQSLRRAKLSLIGDSDARFAHPFSWAPTIVFGDGDSAR
ncbi:MAG: CHAT domain-containing protein [Candidatus Eremiobacteraeota bacterium]|nr:CHAT domain-containing protein [Candidatus Eremiobacteraeota bacterium]MBV8366305.1 CHAT domain-containing protein [Candidatus Eremiobacteraeota bacterium]